MLSFHLGAPAVTGHGLPDWRHAVAVLRGAQPLSTETRDDTPPAILPSAAQRRASAATLLAVRVAQDCLAAADGVRGDELCAVFASSATDPAITDAICRELAATRPMLSPIQFHNSVHNAPAGYWSIATGARAATTSLAAHDGSFAAGLLSAAVQMHAESRPVLLIAYELPYPDPLATARPLGPAFATAMLLTPTPQSASLLQCSFDFSPASAPTRLDHADLESLRTSNPAARSLPLLARLATPDIAELRLPYLHDTDLVLSCRPC